jgi:glycosyltransferase involved in cell wall biosynthesis
MSIAGARLSDRGILAALPSAAVASRRSRGRLLLLIDRLVQGRAEQALARYAPRLLAAGFKVRVATLAEGTGNPLAERLAASGIAVDALPFRSVLDAGAGWRLLHHVRSLRPDLIHTQLPWAHVWGTLAARLQGVPALATLHTPDGLDADHPADRCGRLANRLLNRGAARIICVSDGLRRHYQALARPPAAKLLTLHDGIELDAYASLPARDRDALRERLAVPAAAPLAITVAPLRAPTGIDLMLEALELLEPRWPELHYLIVGDGEERAALEAAAQALGLGHRVGFVSGGADVPKLLGCADLFVLPSMEDALPGVLAEAMASGLPIVASAVGGVPELIEHDGNGLLVPAGDAEALALACHQLLASPRRRRVMATRGRQLAAERFAIDVQVARLAGLYDQLIAARR